MTFVTIVLLACVTFTTRYLFLEGRLPVRLSSNFKQFLSFSGPAVLSSCVGLWCVATPSDRQDLNTDIFC